MVEHNSVKREIERLVESARSQGRPDQYTGKRKGTRFNVALPYEATLDPKAEPVTWIVQLHNISPTGFACWSRKRLESNVKFYVRDCSMDHPTQWVPVRVMHCSAGLRGYLLGAKFVLSPEETVSAATFMKMKTPTATASPAALSNAATPPGTPPKLPNSSAP